MQALTEKDVQHIGRKVFSSFTIFKSVDACPVLTETYYVCLAHARAGPDAIEETVLERPIYKIPPGGGR